MNLQVLISTMNQTDYSLLKKMNIQTDAIVVNQCGHNHIEEFMFNGHKIKWISVTEQGIGLSRNTALMRATSDILLFADDDIVYEDDYEEKVLNLFKTHPNVSLGMFNLQSLNPDRTEFVVENEHRVFWYNCLKYGAGRMAVRHCAILHENIMFSLLFGGGAKYQAGEDNLFITKCLQAGLIAFASTSFIGTVEQKTSTWFKGYNEKYYYDRGALFAAMYGKKYKIYLLLLELKNSYRYSAVSFIQRYKLEKKGAEAFRNQDFYL